MENKDKITHKSGNDLENYANKMKLNQNNSVGSPVAAAAYGLTHIALAGSYYESVGSIVILLLCPCIEFVK